MAAELYIRMLVTQPRKTSWMFRPLLFRAQRHEAQRAACRAEAGYPPQIDYGTIVKPVVTPGARSYSQCMTDAGYVP